MNIENEKIVFNMLEIKSLNKKEFVSISIGEDTVVFYILWHNKDDTSSGAFPHTYMAHQYCGGSLYFKSMKKYKIMNCEGCNFRVKIPASIKTIKDLREHFEGNPDSLNDRFEILDL